MNNPISGLLIFIAAFVADWKIGLATVLAGSIATLGEMVSFINKLCNGGVRCYSLFSLL